MAAGSPIIAAVETAGKEHDAITSIISTQQDTEPIDVRSTETSHNNA